MSLLEVKNLHTYFKTKKGIVKAVNDVTYSLDAGKTLGIVGESGSGKSVSAMSIIKLLDGNGYIESGSITFDGKDILQCTDKEMYHIRGNEISVIFQEPMTSLNPVFTVERQIGETLQIHQNMTKKEARKKAVDLLADVKIPNPERVAKQYPFQLSGGMRQRAIIALATFMSPNVVLADEPTTALDVVVQRGILMMLMRLQKQFKNTLVIVSHDMGVHYQITDRMGIMYSGSFVELGRTEDIFEDPIHPYTKMLIGALPRVGDKSQKVGIPGRPPALKNPPPGCRFAARCPQATDKCRQDVPEFREIRPGRFAACHFLTPEVN